LVSKPSLPSGGCSLANSSLPEGKAKLGKLEARVQKMDEYVKSEDLWQHINGKIYAFRRSLQHIWIKLHFRYLHIFSNA
jgi:hypothetical protein